MKLVSTIMISILAVSMTAPVYAKEIALEQSPQFTITDAEALFENDARSMQLAALSQQEMKETEGAWVNFAIGGAVGFGSYALTNYYTDRPITWQGSLYSIGTGALAGGIGGALISASGGGLAGQIAWRPNILASNFGASQYSQYHGW
ncbi:hypothetical protein I5R65_16965 [Herbaspirillum sp. AP02]|uniref:hypothetical protein n=1 Tax=unclassified Herbaspirillum TaxID=2624150 RepID=UPI0015DB65C1|nr:MULTISPECIES: hypothetical protein [unclassified Herbaspirillum]MBG7621157.1 hypothetical protein [Herbaspirillum sp. AP02]NZD68886.1 hypothetical protein [Herbaspirillum sp. AP21]